VKKKGRQREWRKKGPGSGILIEEGKKGDERERKHEKCPESDGKLAYSARTAQVQEPEVPPCHKLAAATLVAVHPSEIEPSSVRSINDDACDITTRIPMKSKARVKGEVQSRVECSRQA